MQTNVKGRGGDRVVEVYGIGKPIVVTGRYVGGIHLFHVGVVGVNHMVAKRVVVVAGIGIGGVGGNVHVYANLSLGLGGGIG